jgi:S1-C subfamily serine protease
VPDLINYGEVKRPLLGVTLVNDKYFKEKGAMIQGVTENGPAQRAGLKGISRTSDGRTLIGDIIKSINNKKIESSNELIETLEKYKPNDKVIVEYARNNQLYQTDVILTSSVDD